MPVKEKDGLIINSPGALPFIDKNMILKINEEYKKFQGFEKLSLQVVKAKRKKHVLICVI